MTIASHHPLDAGPTRIGGAHALLALLLALGAASCGPGRTPITRGDGVEGPPPLAPIVGPAEPGPPGQWGHALAGAEPEQIAAMEWTNYIRGEAGLPYLGLAKELSVAATAHAAYIASNPDIYADGLSLHTEVEGAPGFTGATWWDRVAAAGWSAPTLGEIIAYQPLATASVWQWVDSVYHRLPILSPSASMVGYGRAQGEVASVSVMEIARLSGGGDGPLVGWPTDDAVEVPVSWDGFEIPEPPPPPGGYPSGPVITLHGSPGEPLIVTSTALEDEAGEAVPHQVLDATNDPILKEYGAMAMYADDPLTSATTYRVRIEGTRSGEPFTWTSKFTTEVSIACSPFVQECSIGKACYADKTGTLCAWHGPIAEGGTCAFQNDCTRGATCIGGVCRRYCDPEAADGPQSCDSLCGGHYSMLNTPIRLGVCDPPACSPLHGGCGAGQGCALAPGPTCAKVGALLAGEACAGATDCVEGAACADLTGDGIARCYALCDASPLHVEVKGDGALPVGCEARCKGSALGMLDGSGLGLCVD